MFSSGKHSLRKQIYLLSVQGAHARGFQFKQNSGHEFRSFVESLVLNRTILVCSKFRTDLIYYSDTDRQEEILKVWCRTLGKDYSPGIFRKFLKSAGMHEVLENYFVSLIYLARILDWFHDSKKELNLIIDQEPNHPIHMEIVNCTNSLTRGKDSFSLPLIDADKQTIAYYLFKDTKSFAAKAAKDYLNN